MDPMEKGSQTWLRWQHYPNGVDDFFWPVIAPRTPLEPWVIPHTAGNTSGHPDKNAQNRSHRSPHRQTDWKIQEMLVVELNQPTLRKRCAAVTLGIMKPQGSGLKLKIYLKPPYSQAIFFVRLFSLPPNQ